MQYKLNWGKHRVTCKGQTKTYMQGDIIESDVLLNEKFVLYRGPEPKFKVVETHNTVPQPVIPTVVRSPSKPVEGASEQAPSTDTFIGFTAPVARLVVETTGDAEDPAAWYQENIKPAVEMADASAFEQYGEDVTDTFQRAGPLGFQIRFDGTRYRVLNNKAKVVNGIKKLASSKDVRVFLKRQEEARG